MSRIGKSPILVPNGVEVGISGKSIEVKGPKGSLDFEVPGAIVVRQDGDQIYVERPDDERTNRALHGLTRSLININVAIYSNWVRHNSKQIGRASCRERV